MIPNNLWSDNEDRKDYAFYGKPKPIHLTTNKHFTCLGPVEAYDSNSAPAAAWWLFEYIDSVVKLFKHDGVGYVFYSNLITVSECTQLSAAFDQLGKPLVFYNTGTELMLWWYDPVIEAHTTTVFGVGAYPYATFDVKYEVNTDYSDVLLFYIRDGAIYYRVQRDRYAIEYVTPVIGVAKEILQADMSIDYRLQLVYTI